MCNGLAETHDAVIGACASAFLPKGTARGTAIRPLVDRYLFSPITSKRSAPTHLAREIEPIS